jgi:hypothetical protein
VCTAIRSDSRSAKEQTPASRVPGRRDAPPQAGLFDAAAEPGVLPVVNPQPGSPAADSVPDGAPPAHALAPKLDGAVAWPPELTRRLRVLLHTLPLDALRRSDSMRDPQTRHYDSLSLALRALDTVIDRMGFEDAATSETVSRQLAQVMTAMDEAEGIGPERRLHDAMTDKLLAGLRNEADGLRPFREEYTAVDGEGKANRHYVEFRLLEDSHHPDGRVVLRASNEAANLYLRLLDLDIEDAQAATEAVVESQLQRGRFDEAVVSARQARIQSVRFREKIRTILRDTRRDVDRVDWREEVPRLLGAAIDHIGRRTAVEAAILHEAEAKLATLDEMDTASGRALAQVAELTQDCYRRHTELHGELIGARSVFLDAQAAQSFAPQPSRPWPELLDEVLAPLMGLPRRAAARVVEAGVAGLVGPRPPAVLDLDDLCHWLLAPRRPNVAREIPVEPVDAADIEAELRRYAPAVRAAAEALLAQLAGLGGGARLSEVLAAAHAVRLPREVGEVVALLALQGFEPEDSAAAGVSAELLPDQAQLSSDGPLYGDDLLLMLAQPRAADVEGG